MNTQLLQHLEPQVHNSGRPNTSQPPRKRDKFLDPFRIIKSRLKKSSNQSMSTQYASPANNEPLPTPVVMEQNHINIFPENVPKPTLKTRLPRLQERIERTDQLLYCNTLLLQSDLALPTAAADEGIIDDSATNTLQEPALDKTQLDWLAETKVDPMEEDHIRSLVVRMVEKFISDTAKNSAKVAEVVALGPVLPKEDYRRLLSSIIKELDESLILDLDMLQGLVQLVQAASPEYLVADDLVKVLRTLRIRLHGTHQQMPQHPYHLTLAISRVLDVMTDSKVQGLDRVVEHEPLSGVLLCLRDTSDPYLLYQACYAFQSLQYVPDDETVVQAVLRHSIDVVDGLVKVSGVVKLDLDSVLDGLRGLQAAFVNAMEFAGLAFEGVCSLLENGRGVFVSMKEGLGTGQKRPWYPAVRAGYALAHAGQLKDLNQFIYEAPCRSDPLFQWGICQLLGEIAIDPVWTVDTRLQAICLLGHLYKTQQDWTKNENIKAWMLTIIDKLGSTTDQAISACARSLLQNLVADATSLTRHPYPLTGRLPIPDASPVLTEVQQISYFERKLHSMKVCRLEETKQLVYIPPMAKANLTAPDNDLSPLMDKVQEFLFSDRLVMLILGDSGSGKSTFNKHLESELLQSYNYGDRIPLFITLPTLERPQKELIKEQLRLHRFYDSEIEEMELYHQFILICDGYDESQLRSNLHSTNGLNRYGRCDTKLIITCRTQYLVPDYHDLFAPQRMDHYSLPNFDLYEEAVIAPFSEAQIESYVDQYVPLEPRTWTTKDYMDRLTSIRNLMDLVKNPFLLSLCLEALPGFTEGKDDLSTVKVTRIQLYDTFVRRWLDINKRRLLSNNMSKEEYIMLDQLKEAGFIATGIDYSTRLATTIFKMQDGNPVVQYIHIKDQGTWKAEFFGQDPMARLLRESSPLIRTGTSYRFLHRSMLEYFLSRAVFDPDAREGTDVFDPQSDLRSCDFQPLDPSGPLFTRHLIKEPSIIQFLCERVEQSPYFKQQLRAVIELSKADASAATATANAFTILVRAGVSFNGADLRGIRTPGADLSGGQFDSAQFQGADLRDVTFIKSWLRKADLSNARMEGVRFGELPYMESTTSLISCAFRPDGKVVAVGSLRGVICLYDTITWKNLRSVRQMETSEMCAIVFSTSGKRTVAGDSKGVVRVLDLSSDEGVMVMKGHTDRVNSVAFSPCDKQVASASKDGTVRLWNVESGEIEFILKDHTSGVLSVIYSPDGRRLVSGNVDGTIRLWEPKTGKSKTTSTPICCVCCFCLAYSPDGLTIAAGEIQGDIRLWDAVSGEPRAVMSGHTSAVTCVEFSPNNKRIASSSHDYSVRLWDVLTGALLSVLGSHSGWAIDLSFSPDGFQVVSVGADYKARLWDVNVELPSAEPKGHTDKVISVSYSADGRFIFSGSSGNIVRQWNSTIGFAEIIRLKDPILLGTVALSHDGYQFACGNSKGAIQLRNSQTGAAEGELQGDSNAVNMLTYSPCGRWVVSSSSRRWMVKSLCPKDNVSVRLWDLQELGRQFVLVDSVKDNGDAANCATFSSTGTSLATGHDDGTVRLYDTHTRSLWKTIGVDSGHPVYALAFSPSDHQLAMRTKTAVCLWNRDSEQPTITLHHNYYIRGVRCLVYSSCGTWIASGCSNDALVLWNRPAGGGESWRCAVVVSGFFGPVNCIAWSQTDSWEFVTGSDDRSVRIWRILKDDDGRSGISIRQVWGSDNWMLCASELIFRGAVGLSAVNQKLLIQRGAVDDSSALEEGDDTDDDSSALEEEEDTDEE